MSTPARSCHCPNCGGEVDERARRCGYCNAPVATVRCVHCYSLNVPHADYCADCGRELGLEPLGEPGTLPCPDCRTGLAAFRGGCGMLYDCATCGGQFVDLPLLQALLEEREVYGSVLPRRTTPANPLSQRVRYLPCPACKELMNRRNFGGTSGIIVDSCQAHGMWFDTGELPRVLSFVQKGGLARERQRERERAERERRRRVESAATALSLKERSLLERYPEAGPSLLAALVDSLLTAVSWALDD